MTTGESHDDLDRMRSVDIHAHVVPRGVWAAHESGDDWYGALAKNERFDDYLMIGALCEGDGIAKTRWTIDERIRYMDAVGTDVHVLSVAPALLNYECPVDQTMASAREINEEIAGMVTSRPDRFEGLATLPLPEVELSVAELERSIRELGLKGVELDTRVNGRHWDEPDFDPIFEAAEDLGATLFFHPSRSLVWERTQRYHLGNTVGNLLEDALAASVLISGGVLERHPDLKVVIAHSGGPICFGIGHMDRAWHVDPEARTHIPFPPSRYLRRLYYDSLTLSEGPLRFLVDVVGADRVVLGSDWPYASGPESPAHWVMGLRSLSAHEKELIMHANLDRLLELPAMSRPEPIA
ncbi:MAG: amidohydrolase [Actinomycetota bacterium]|nr:amidohydrolase [Actinomycetota bacterium]